MTEYKTEYKKKENTLLDHNFLKRGKEKRREREAPQGDGTAHLQ